LGPQELVAAVTARGVKIYDWQSLYDELKKRYDDEHAQWIEIVEKRDNLIDALRAQPSEPQSEKGFASEPDTPEQKSLGARERESLLKLVIGMAIKGYDHNPKASRSSTAKDIAHDLHLIGISLDEDTVRKYLAEGRELLPGDEAE